MRATLVAVVIGLASAARAAVPYQDLYTLTVPAGLFLNGDAITKYASGGQVVGLLTPSGNGSTPWRAVVWKGVGTSTDLHPASGYTDSFARGGDGVIQVGVAFGTPTGGAAHAAVWNGTNQLTDIHPAGHASSSALDARNGQIVGFTNDGGEDEQAALWTGPTATSAVNLHPAGYYGSTAEGTDGVQQVGYADDGTVRAMVWKGTAASAVDLHPASGFTSSTAIGVGNGKQVGRGMSGGQFHALAWSGTAASAVDLNPVGYTTTSAFAVDEFGQVGFGQTAGQPAHALFWMGTAASVIDLHASLPATFIQSRAYDIRGNTVYGLALDTSGRQHAVAWLVPEPSLLGVVGVGGVALTARRRRASRS